MKPSDSSLTEDTNQVQNTLKSHRQPPKTKPIQKTPKPMSKDHSVINISDDDSIEYSRNVPIVLETYNEQEYSLSDGIDSQESNQDSDPEATCTLPKQQPVFSPLNLKCTSPDDKRFFTTKRSRDSDTCKKVNRNEILVKTKKSTSIKSQTQKVSQINDEILVETKKSTQIKYQTQKSSWINDENIAISLKPFEAESRDQTQILIYLKHYAELSKMWINIISASWKCNESYCLTEKIIEQTHIYLSQIKNIEQKTLVSLHLLKKTLALFRTGIYIPADLVRQKRFKPSKLVSYEFIKEKSDQVHYLKFFDATKQQDHMFRKLTFSPSKLVTGQLFFRILKSEIYEMVSGHYGVGKTYSVILLKILYDNIFCYQHYVSSICKRSRSVEVHVEQEPIKMVYIDLEHQCNPERLLTSLKTQCFEMIQAIPNFNLEPEFIDKTLKFIASFYASKFDKQILLVVDQINILGFVHKQVEIMADLKRSNKQIEIEVELGKYRQQSIDDLIKKEKSLNKIIRIIKESFSRIIYLSSINVESQLFKSPISHQRICQSKYQLNMNKFIQSKSLFYDFASYVYFKIQTIDENLDLPNLKKIKVPDILNYLEQKQYFPYIPLHIDEYFHDLELDTNLPQMIEHIFNRSVDGICQKVRGFIYKYGTEGQAVRTILMVQLVISAMQILQHSQNSQRQQSVVAIYCPEFENDYDHLVFQYDKSLRKLTTTIHPYILVQIYRDLKYQLYNNLLNSTVPLFQLIRGPVMQRLIFQSIILDLLMKKYTFLTVNIYEKIGSQWSKTGLLMHFAMDKAYPFRSLPKKNQKVQEYQFLGSFKQRYEQCQSWTVFLPVKNSIITKIQSHITHNQVDYTSKCIDFITSSYSNNVFQIIAWDVTINKFAVKEKLKKFWLAFNQFKDKFKRRLNESTKTKLSYIILMDKKQISQQFSIAKILREVDSNLASHYTFKEHAATCVISHKQKNCLLRKISVLDFDDLKFQSQNLATSKALAYYQKFVRELLKKPEEPVNAN